jgi:hypothetical protein
MICDIGDNSPRKLDTPIDVQCKLCGQIYSVRLFPLRAECQMSELSEFLQQSDQQITGLGDVVASVIKTVTFGLVQPSSECGCEQRKEMLNRWWSWKSAK